MFAAEVLVAVGPSQYGCGQSGGAVALRHFVEASLLQDPSLSLAVVDVRNMHGSLGVANIAEQVQNSLPRMRPLVAPGIRVRRTHINKDHNGVLWPIEAYGPLNQG